MDGFTLIPKRQKSEAVANANNSQESFSNINNNVSENTNIRLAMDTGINLPQENISEEVVQNLENKKSSVLDGGLMLFVSVLVFLGSLAYCGYLLFLRQITTAQIQDYALKLKSLESKIDKREITELQNMDTVLKSLKTRMDAHVLPTEIFSFINKNMRSTLQLTEYKVEKSQDGLDVIFSCVSPNFKDMAEQTEKFVELKRIRL